MFMVPGSVARLGEVLYWAGCVIAVAMIGLTVVAYYDGTAPSGSKFPVFVGGFAFVVWLIGRACRYVLAGR